MFNLKELVGLRVKGCGKFRAYPVESGALGYSIAYLPITLNPKPLANSLGSNLSRFCSGLWWNRARNRLSGRLS